MLTAPWVRQIYDNNVDDIEVCGFYETLHSNINDKRINKLLPPGKY